MCNPFLSKTNLYLPILDLQLGNTVDQINFQQNWGYNDTYPYAATPENITTISCANSNLSYDATLSGT